MEKEINNNGYDYVDLGLPSGTLWATMNVGASKPSDYGLYFQWGDTKGYTKEQVGKDKQFNWSDYKWSRDGSNTSFSKYIKEGATLNLKDDAANANMEGIWHMPTPDQISELINNTTSEWATKDGVKGTTFTSKKDNSKSIFIPAAGFAYGGSVYDIGDVAVVWSSVLDTDDAGDGQDLDFDSDDADLGDSGRFYGFSVRGVIG